jgi:hypothetical protein
MNDVVRVAAFVALVACDRRPDPAIASHDAATRPAGEYLGGGRTWTWWWLAQEWGQDEPLYAGDWTVSAPLALAVDLVGQEAVDRCMAPLPDGASAAGCTFRLPEAPEWRLQVHGDGTCLLTIARQPASVRRPPLSSWSWTDHRARRVDGRGATDSVVVPP